MTSIIPYFAGFITVLFGLAMYFAIQGGREIKENMEERSKSKINHKP